MQVLFLPGFMCDERLFSEQIRYLKKRIFRHFVKLDQQASIEEMADYTLSLFEACSF